MNQLRLGLFSLFLLTVHSSGWAQTPKFKTHSLKLEFDFDYYDTKDNFDRNGTFSSSGSGHSYKYYRFDSKGTYAFSRKFSVWGGVDIVTAESANTGFIRANTAINQLTTGARYKLFYSRKFQIIADGSLTLPKFTIDKSIDNALVGEGALVIKPGAWGILKLKKLKIYSFLGYAYRDEGRASLLDWKLGASYRIKPIRFGGELYGFSPVSIDDYTSNPGVRTSVTNRVNGRSLKFYSVNPDLVALKLWGETPLNKDFAIKLGYEFDMNGQNYAKGSTITAGVIWNINSPRRKQKSDVFNRQSREDTNNFSIDAQQYDEKLFQEPRKKKRRKKRKQKSNKQILDEAEDFLD